ncbi:Retrovirus-related Pol polyprotein from transposon TNT 1-94 [Linum perenne]
MVSELDVEKMEYQSVRFNGKNYAIWEFQFRYVVASKGLLSCLDGPVVEPALAEFNRSRETWLLNNARVFSWLINSVDPRIALTFRTFTSATAIWSHLERTYAKPNSSKLFEIEYELAKLTQGDKDINSFYNIALDLWTEQDLLSRSLLSSAASAEVLEERKRTRVLQFLMKLQPEFESVRSQAILNNITEMEDILGDLLRVETRLHTQAQVNGAATSGTVFAAGRRPQFYPSTGRSPTGQQRFSPNSVSSSTPLSETRCCHCNELGHVVGHCKQRNVCNYSKRPGHIITECCTLQNRTTRRGDSSTPAVYSAANTQSPQEHSNGSPASGTPSSASIAALVQEALSSVLPSAIQAAFSTVSLTGKSHTWHIDSAAFNHMSSNLSLFKQYTHVSNVAVEVANGDRLKVAGMGNIQTRGLVLSNSLHVPSLVLNLVSVGQLVDDGCDVIFSSSGCTVQDRMTHQEIGRGSKDGRNFYLKALGAGGGDYDRIHASDGRASHCFVSLSSVSSGCLDCTLSSDSFDSSDSACLGHIFLTKGVLNKWNIWHSRLGHPHAARLRMMFTKSILPDRIPLLSSPSPTCELCISAKMIKRPFSSSTTEVHQPFDLVHTDLWGPAPVNSRLGFRYFALFIDHKTRYAWVYFLRLKSDLILVAKEFVRMVQTQFGKTVKVIRSDPDGEFSSHALKEFYTENGMLYQQSCPGVSEQNGLVERKHRHVLDLARALLLESRVPNSFWQEVIHTVVYLINRQISPNLDNRSPFHELFGRSPNYSMLRVFGCLCFVLLPSHERSKLQSRTARCLFVGFSDHHKGYLCYDPLLHRIRIAYHVVFLEHIPYYSARPSSFVPETGVVHLPCFDEPEMPDANIWTAGDDTRFNVIISLI